MIAAIYAERRGGQAMMRHRQVREASLLAALSLLTSAATANAECGWVLWITTVDYQGKNLTHAVTQSPLVAFPTYKDCAQAAEREMKKVADRDREYRRLGARVTVSESLGSTGWTVRSEWGNDTVQTHISSCFPDTVDPRGPKGAK